MSEFLKPQSPLQHKDGAYIYPLTTGDQVIMDDGSRLNAALENIVYVSELGQEEATAPLNADTLGGMPAEYYATKEDLNNFVTQEDIDTAIDAVTTESLGITPESIGAMSMDLLWENASPTSEFAAQDITVDWIQDYSMYIVGFKMNTNSGYHTWNILTRGDTGIMHDQINAITDDYPILFVARTTLLSTNGYIRFGDSYSRNVSGAVNVVNTRLIPIAIYGIKGVSV